MKAVLTLLSAFSVWQGSAHVDSIYGLFVNTIIQGCKYCPSEILALTSANGYIPGSNYNQVCSSGPPDEGIAAFSVRPKTGLPPWVYYSAQTDSEVRSDGKPFHVTHCNCWDPVASGPLSDTVCSGLNRAECGHYWKNMTNTSNPLTTRYKSWLTPYHPATEYVPWYPTSYVNLSNVNSSNFAFNRQNFTYDTNTMIRLMGRCGHCLPGYIEGTYEYAFQDEFTGEWTVDATSPSSTPAREQAAGWNNEVFVPGADPQPNLLQLRRRVGAIRGCSVDPCWGAGGQDKCKAAHKASCDATRVITCGPCDCGWGPSDYNFTRNNALSAAQRNCSFGFNDICYTYGTLYGPNPDVPSVATVTGVALANDHDVAFVPISNAACAGLNTAVPCVTGVCFSYEKLSGCTSQGAVRGGTNFSCSVSTSKATFGWDSVVRVCIRNPSDGQWHAPSTGPWPIYVILTQPQLISVAKSASVTSIPEGTPTLVTYGVTVNYVAGVFPMSLKTFVDNKFGDLLTVAGLISRTTCATGMTVGPANPSYHCEFDVTLTLPTGSHTDNITVSFSSVPDPPFAVRSGTNVSNPVTVAVTDVIPTISVTKEAIPTAINEGTAGQNVQYRITLRNTGTSTTDILSVMSLVDDKFGNVMAVQGNLQSTNCTTAVLGTFGPGVSKVCVFAITPSYLATFDAINSPHVNRVTLTMRDEELNAVNASATASLTINDVPPNLAVTKTASVTTLNEGQPATVVYTITTSLLSPLTDTVTVTSLVDSIFGDITTTGHDGITATTCALNSIVTTAAFYRCTFTTSELAPNFGDHANTVVSTGRDNEGTVRNANATLHIPIANTKPTLTVVKSGSSAAPAGSQTVVEGTRTLVTFTVTINNTSPGGARDPITINKLSDSKFGNFASSAVGGSGDSPSLASSTCTLGTVVVAGSPYTCSFSSYLTLGFNASTRTHVDTVTVAGRDDDNVTPTSDTGDILSNTVTISSLDVPPALSIVYAVWPESVPEAAGDNGIVKYNVIVTNTGAVSDPWNIVSMIDTKYGNVGVISGQGNGQVRATTCTSPYPVVQPGAKYQCAFDVKIDQNTGSVDDTLNITVVDDEGTRTWQTASKSLPVTNVAPVATLVAVPDLKNVKPVRYSILVENPSTSHDDLTITKYWSGTVQIAPALQAPITATDCTVPFTLTPGTSKSCYYEVPLDLTINATNNEPTVEGVDDDGVAFSVKGARSIVSVQLRCCDDPPWTKSLPGQYKLTCPTGWTAGAGGTGQMSRTCGTNGRWGAVDLSQCVDPLNCVGNVCGAHGSCVEGVGDAFTCQCNAGFSGATCSITIGA